MSAALSIRTRYETLALLTLFRSPCQALDAPRDFRYHNALSGSSLGSGYTRRDRTHLAVLPILLKETRLSILEAPLASPAAFPTSSQRRKRYRLHGGSGGSSPFFPRTNLTGFPNPTQAIRGRCIKTEVPVRGRHLLHAAELIN